MEKPTLKTVFRNALIYFVLGFLWIILTDRILLYLVPDSQTITLIQTYKGFIFVVASAVLLYFIGRRDLTALEYYHETLQRERHLMERVMDTSPVGITVVNRDGKITFANYWAEQVLGLTRDEITQLAYNAPVWHITDNDGNPFPEEKLPFNRVMNTGQAVYDVRHAIEWPDGRRVLLSINASPLLDENGLVEGVAATIEDITKRIEAEKKLKESEERFRSAFEKAAIGHVLAGSDGRLIRANKALCDMLGYAEKELVSRHFTEITHPDDQGISQECARSLLAGEKDLCHFEKRYLHKDGHTVWGMVSTFLYRDVRNNPEYFITDIQDITEHKRAEEALKEKEFLLSESQRISHIGSWSWELPSNRISWTKEMYNIYGVSPDAFVFSPQSFLGLIHPDYRAAMEEWIRACIAGEKPQDLEFSILLADGGTRIIHGRGDLQYDANNRPIGMVGTAQDITVRKRAEDEMRLLHILTKTISESEDFHDAMNIVIRKFCEVTGWVYGEAWVPADEKSYFEMDSAWYSRIKGMEEFRNKSLRIKFNINEGIPGRVWASKKPLWVRDISRDTNFARTQLAEQFGLKAGMGIPIIAGDDVVAVLTFFVFEDRKEDDALLTLISSITAQLGTLFRRKLAEEALAKSESRLRAIIETEPECIKMVAADGSLLDMNPAGLAMIEAESLEQVKGISIYSLFDAKNVEKYKQMNEDIFRGKSGVLEFKMTGLKGTSRWLESHGTPFRNANNEIVAQLAITRDITERKRVEEELSLLQTLLQDITLSEDFSSSINICIRKICEATGWVFGEAWIPASNGSHLDCSTEWYGSLEELKRFRKISEGFKFQQGIGLPGRVWLSKNPAWIKDVTLDSNFPRAPYAMEAGLKAAMAIPVLSGEEVVAVLEFFVFESREEDRRLVDLVSTVAAYLGVLFQRKKVEGELRKLHHAVEQSPTSVFITDADMNIEYINPKFTAITGYSREEVIGKKPDLVTSGVATISDTQWHGEFLARKKSGEPFWEYATISPIRNAEGTITHFIGIHEDITERRKIEDQLRHAQKIEAIGQLVGGIAHDFNNILTAIIGFAGILRMQMEDDDPLLGHVKEIIESGERGANLTQSLLVFGSKQAIYPTPVNLNEIIEKVKKLLSRLIGENIELKTATTDKELTVLADSIQIEQVLINLATNARDAMPQGGTINIETSLGRIDSEFIKTFGYGEPREYALISVSDTGAGMDEKTKERIFEPFFTTKDVGKGTGLGLAIVFGIVKQHNGFINVYSEVGGGTTFRIYLPLARSEEKISGPSKHVPLALSGTETILVAEDDGKVRKLSRTVLEMFGYNVIEAVDGDDAVRKYMENKDNIQLLLLDVMMPRKNGREVYNEIRKVSQSVKALFLSGYTADVMLERGILEEGMDFVPKPISSKEFLKKVREVLDK